MIKNIELYGFKSFVSDRLTFGHLTLLTGLNSSGKSSVIQAVQLLEKSAKRENIYLEGHGDIKELMNPYCKYIEITGECLYAPQKDGKRLAMEIKTHARGWSEDWTGDITGFPEVIYISADRFGSETSIPIQSSNFKLGRKGENMLKCIEYYSDYILNDLLKHENSEGDTFLYNLKAWLGVISPNVKFDHKIQMMSDSSYTTFNGHRAKNVGFGLSYALPVITALLLGSITKNSIVIIENPEAHLHPKGQTELARLIALCVEVGTQVVIETHSDHIFYGTCIYAKNSKSNFHEKVKIYWFELDKNANTEIQEAILDENGRIEDAPKGLFDQFEINASKLL